MKKESLVTKKIVAFLLLVLYMGCISLLAQNTPRTYLAAPTNETISIDGKMEESTWQKAKCSDAFQNIEGNRKATFETKFKMIWDDTYMYFSPL